MIKSSKYVEQYGKEIEELCKQGLRQYEIANKLNLRNGAVRYVIKSLGLKMTPIKSTTDIYKDDISKLLKQGYKQKQIAFILNISHETVRYIMQQTNLQNKHINGKQHKHKDDIIRLFYEGYSAAKTAIDLGLSRGIVQKCLKDNGLCQTINDFSTNKYKDAVIKLCKDGHTINEIAKELEIARHTVRHILFNANLKAHTRQTYGKDHHNWTGYNDLNGKYFFHAKYGAERRNISFNITIEDMWNKWVEQNGICNLTGWKLELGKNEKDPGTASLDRIDSSRGYEIDNIQWVHKNINKMKMNLTQKDFINFCHAVSHHNTYLG